MTNNHTPSTEELINKLKPNGVIIKESILKASLIHDICDRLKQRDGRIKELEEENKTQRIAIESLGVCVNEGDERIKTLENEIKICEEEITELGKATTTDACLEIANNEVKDRDERIQKAIEKADSEMYINDDINLSYDERELVTEHNNHLQSIIDILKGEEE